MVDPTHAYQPRIQMIPESLWGKNLRKPESRWRKLRAYLLANQGMNCAICGKQVTVSRQLQAHEEWEYDETTNPATARLTEISLVCKLCHYCEHWGRAKQIASNGYPELIDDTISHFCRLNQVTENEFRMHELAALEDWKRRNQLEWRVDFGNIQDWIADVIAASREGRKEPPQAAPLSPIAAALDPIFNIKARRAAYDATRRAAKKSGRGFY